MNDKGKYWDEAWNTVIGCTKCSPGCLNCWAESLHSMRYAAYWTAAKLPEQYRFPFNEIQLLPDRLDKPLHWRKPRTIFVNNMGDTFHPAVPFEFVDKMMAVMALCPQHKFLVLTKRPDRMVKYINTKYRWKNHVLKEAEKIHGPWGTPLKYHWPQPHIIHMTTICNQEEADKNIPLILQMQGAKLGLSIEPLLSEIDINQNYFDGKWWGDMLHWVVCGVESGPNRRPCKIEWIESIVEQCKAAGVRCYVKQMNLNGKVVKDIKQFPKQLQVRQTI